jgi:ATP-dependent DNA helicase RecG
MEALFLQSTGHLGYVLLVRIEKSSVVHHTADNTVYVRIGAQSLPVKDPQRVMELQFAKGAVSFEDQTLPDLRTEEISDAPELGRFLAAYSPKIDPLEFVTNQNLVDRASWHPRVAGILLFNGNPSATLPRKCAVKIARYETKEDDPERDHLKDIFTLEGPLYPLIHEAVEKTSEIMSSVAVWTTAGLATMAYPPEAIWEVTVNAFIHRDYSISDDIQIYIFDNRIEIVSPGKFPGFITAANILDSRYSRNPKIVRTLSRYPDPPNKDLGEGLNTAFQKMMEWKLKRPEVLEDGNYVRVIIPHAPLATPAEAILEFLANSPTITNRQGREITGIRSENTMKREFYALRDAGIIEMVPELKGSSAAWRKK